MCGVQRLARQLVAQRCLQLERRLHDIEAVEAKIGQPCRLRWAAQIDIEDPPEGGDYRIEQATMFILAQPIPPGEFHPRCVNGQVSAAHVLGPRRSTCPIEPRRRHPGDGKEELRGGAAEA